INFDNGFKIPYFEAQPTCNICSCRLCCSNYLIAVYVHCKGILLGDDLDVMPLTIVELRKIATIGEPFWSSRVAILLSQVVDTMWFDHIPIAVAVVVTEKRSEAHPCSAGAHAEFN